MSSSSNKAILVPEEEAAAVKKALAWGTSPRLYQSYGDMEATPSFTVLSPPMGLDFFTMLDGHCECKHLLMLLRDAIARQVYMELFSDSPRFLDGMSPVGRWVTTLRETFRDFQDEVAVYSQGEPGVLDVPGAAIAIVALVLEKYLVIGNRGASKAVLSHDGELVELSSNSQIMVSKASSYSCICFMSG